jgi:3-dehydroquinate synthase
MQKISVKVLPRPYVLMIDDGVLNQAGSLLRQEFPKRSRVVVVTVPRVRKLWGKALSDSLKKSNFAPIFVTLPDGERHKTIRTVEKAAEQLAQLGCDRQTVVVAFGGGVVGDTAGLMASLYMRGVDFVQIPTTLLAQVDASIGGKTGVSLRSGKNLIGTFHQPRMVLVDPEVLKTLPDREFQSGLYESLKCAAIGDAALFSAMEGKPAQELRNDADAVRKMIISSVKFKSKIVATDTHENDLRRVLNFGHTIGHALEAESAYRRFLHGEAVAWGMIAATRLAAATNRIDTHSARRIINAIRAVGPLPAITARGKNILQLLRADKKNADGLIHFVLPTRIGRVEIVNDVPETLIVAVIDDLRNSTEV